MKATRVKACVWKRGRTRDKIKLRITGCDRKLEFSGTCFLTKCPWCKLPIRESRKAKT